MVSRGLIAALRIAATLPVFIFAVLWAASPSYGSAASAWQRAPESGVRLLSAVSGTGDLSTLPLGLEFELAPGWKTYWRSPGDGGFPPKLDWSGSENVASAEIAWPAPERFSILGIDSFGYRDAVVLPIAVQLAEPGRAAELHLTLDYLTCEEICVPQRAELALTVPPGPAEPSAFAHLIDSYRGRVPGPPGPMLSIDSARWTDANGRPALLAVASAAEPFRQPDLFIEGLPSADWGRPSLEIQNDGRRASIVVPRLDTGDLPGDERSLKLTLVDGERAVERTLSIGVGQHGAATVEPLSAAGEESTAPAMLAVLAIALLGGLILNLMPCVLPVLSIKVLGLLKHGGADVSAARRSFLATSAGILACFLLLAGAAAAIRAGGVAVGWGMQFQQPAFLIIMTMILVLFACNLWGLYEFALPSWLDVGGREGGGLSGPFLTGMLATLLATPCSAPFVGTAVAYALSRGTLEIFLIFVALGVGLALPYLAIAAWPRLATMLPRPGNWMIWLRRILGFALLGTAIWLLSVLQAQTDARVSALVGSIALAVIALLWLGRNVKASGRAMAAGLLIAAAVASPFLLYQDRSSSGRVMADSRWEAFDPSGIDSLVAQGKIVFVDVTADWCITCQVNKAAVLDREPVASRLFEGEKTRPMRADWTRPSDEISAYLASFGRYGIPFNAVYGPGAPEGIVLPELLSADAVGAALDRASQGAPQRVSSR